MILCFCARCGAATTRCTTKLEADKTAVGRQRLHYFLINDGPWSRLDSNEPFIEGVPHEKPPHANFYPDDITKDEFNSWLAGLPGSEKEKATGYFYTIRRDASGKLMSVPYSEEYREFLEPAAKLLREAAALTTNQTLKDFLTKRADAFASNDYYASDVAWMDLNAPIDVTIGPYETYEDELFGYKAAFEAYVTLTDAAESAKLRKVQPAPAGAGKQSADGGALSQSKAGRVVADARCQ